jgi:hypothetical protein
VILFDSKAEPRGAWRVLGLLPTVIFAAPGVIVLNSGAPTVPLEWALFALWGLVTCIATTVGVIHLCSVERLEVDGSHLHYVRQVLTWRREWSLSLANIQELVIPGAGREYMRGSWGVGVPALVIRSAGRVYRCCFAIRPSKAEAIAQEVRAIAGAA